MTNNYAFSTARILMTKPGGHRSVWLIGMIHHAKKSYYTETALFVDKLAESGAQVIREGEPISEIKKYVYRPLTKKQKKMN